VSKYYITKYALTKGIIATDREGWEVTEHGALFRPRSYAGYYSKGWWFEVLEEAIQHANELKAKKIRSLQKQLKKLEGMDTFRVVDMYPRDGDSDE